MRSFGQLARDSLKRIHHNRRRRRSRRANRRRPLLEPLETRMLLVSDFGDAPDTGAGAGAGNYHTLANDNGASHTMISGLRLGAALDADSGTLQNLTANADDVDQALPDDEDGLVNPANDLRLTAGVQPRVNVSMTNTTGNAATLWAWIDYNNDGIFDNTAERAQSAVPSGTDGGITTLTFPAVPSGFTGRTYARFRLSTDPAAARSTGAASDGEVEDYVVHISRPGVAEAKSITKIADQLSGTPTLADRDLLGSSMSSLGDLDGDGVADLAVGAYQDDTGGENRGAVHVLFLNTDGTVKSSQRIAHLTGGGPTLANRDAFGSGLSSLGDLNGDGVTDLAVGAARDDSGGVDRGAVYVLFMNTDGTVKSSQRIAHLTGGGPTLADRDSFGWSVSSLGDLDADGVTDLAVGANRHDTGGENRGAVFVLLLNSDGTVKRSQQIAHLTGGGPALAGGDEFGIAVSSLGDLDGDGVTDMAVGASGDDTGGHDRGAVYVLLMNSSGTVKSLQRVADNTGGGPALGDGGFFGFSVSSLGDLDGNGLTDLAAGAFRDTTVGGGRGAVYMLLMNSDGTAGSSKKIAHRTNGGPTLHELDFFGWSSASLGDLDGDGVTDLAVGNPGDDTGGDRRGAVHVLWLTSASAPSLTSFTRQTPATPQTSANSLVFRATFDEAVINVDSADFVVNGTTTATVTNVTPINAETYDLTVSGGDLVGLNGRVGVDLAHDQDIEDLVGDPLRQDEPATDETYVLANVPIQVAGQVINGGRASRSGVATLMLQFDQPLTVDSAAPLRLLNHTTGLPVNIESANLLNNGSTVVTWDLSGVSLPDGVYTATLPAAGTGLAGTHSWLFHVLAGDSSGNAQVDFADFGELAGAFNTIGGPIFGPGDLNGDGNVDFTDFGILASSFNHTLTFPSFDLGDAPETGSAYPTTLANNGARHVLGSGLFLGSAVDSESDGQPDDDAAGDDDAGDDEDGVTFGTLQAGNAASVQVTVAAPGNALLNAWIDFNADGDWADRGEQVLLDQAVSNGVNELTIQVPWDAAAGPTYARFRVTSSAGYPYFGLAPDGEVEDYLVTVSPGAGGLIGYWPFDADGTDRSPGGRNFDLSAGLGFTSGLFGQAMYLNNNGDHFARRPEDDAIFDFGTNDFTIQVWVNFNDTDREQTLFEKFSGRGGPGWTLTKLGGNRFQFFAGTLLNSPVLTIPSGVWHQVLARRSGNILELFFDGNSVAVGTHSGPISDTTNPLLVGKRNDDDGRNFAVNGRIDEVAVWDRALNDAEIFSIFNGGAGTPVCSACGGSRVGQRLTGLTGSTP